MTTERSPETVLKTILRLEAQLPAQYCCTNGDLIEFRHDFDHEEIRVRRDGGELIRLDDDRLVQYIRNRNIEQTQAAVAELLGEICRTPDRFRELLVAPRS